jgi:hypothetical protein
VPQQVARVSGGLDLGRPAVLGLAALNAPFTGSTPSAKPVAQCAFSGLSWRVPNIGCWVWSVTSIPG